MLNDLVTFDFENEPVRTVQIDGETWFIGKDVCRCLGIENPNDALGRIPDDERKNGVGATYPVRQDRLATAINEPGVYRLIFTSRLPSAERFKHWIFHDVLPSLRKTGRYAFDDLDPDKTAQKLAIVRETRLTHGKCAARQIWELLGLPTVGQVAEKQQDRGLLGYVQDFLDEQTEPHKGGEVSAREMHRRYILWAGENMAPLIMGSAFGRFIAIAGIGKRKTGGNSVYTGIRLLTPDEARLRT